MRLPRRRTRRVPSLVVGLALLGPGCEGSFRKAAAPPPRAEVLDSPARRVDPADLERGPESYDEVRLQPPERVVRPPRRHGAAAGVEFVEMMTGGAAFEEVVPVVVAIHGLGDAPEHFLHLVERFEQRTRFIIPRAIEPYGDGFSWFPLRARDPDVEGLSRGVAHAADRIAEALHELNVPTPENRPLIVTGFSQGGILSFTLATRHPDLFAAAIPVGGWLPPPLYPGPDGRGRTFPWIVALHGDADPAVRIEPTRAAVTHLEGIGFNVALHEYEGIRHEIPRPMRAELYELLELAVRGMPPPPNRRGAGPSPSRARP